MRGSPDSGNNIEILLIILIQFWGLKKKKLHFYRFCGGWFITHPLCALSIFFSKKVLATINKQGMNDLDTFAEVDKFQFVSKLFQVHNCWYNDWGTDKVTLSTVFEAQRSSVALHNTDFSRLVSATKHVILTRREKSGIILLLLLFIFSWSVELIMLTDVWSSKAGFWFCCI